MTGPRRPGIDAICDADARTKDPVAAALADLVAADWLATSYAAIFPYLEAHPSDLVPRLVHDTARMVGSSQRHAPGAPPATSNPEERA